MKKARTQLRRKRFGKGNTSYMYKNKCSFFFWRLLVSLSGLVGPEDILGLEDLKIFNGLRRLELVTYGCICFIEGWMDRRSEEQMADIIHTEKRYRDRHFMDFRMRSR